MKTRANADPIADHRKPERGPPQARTRATASQNAGHRKPERGPP